MESFKRKNDYLPYCCVVIKSMFVFNVVYYCIMNDTINNDYIHGIILTVSGF